MTVQPDSRQLVWIKALLVALCLAPCGRLLFAWDGEHSQATVEFAQRWTGTWTFNLLLMTLCISPLRAMSQWHWLLRLRRLLGLLTFFYATLHILIFVGWDHGYAPSAIAGDLFKRPFVSVGFAAYLLLIPLAATSNQWAVRRLGGRRWQELHRNIYLVGIFASVHYLWLTKIEQWYWPTAYVLALALLLGWRIRERRRKAIPAASIQDSKPLRFFRRKPD